MCSWRSNSEAAAHEVDHIHNLPDALKTEEYHRIRYYLDVERECYWKNKHRENRQKIEGLWAELDEEVAAGGADVK